VLAQPGFDLFMEEGAHVVPGTGALLRDGQRRTQTVLFVGPEFSRVIGSLQLLADADLL
jgi:hypothetical protein